MKSRTRLLTLLLLLAMAGGYYAYSPADPEPTPSPTPAPVASNPDKSGTLPLDAETKAQIRSYFAGVTIEPGKNDLNEAIHLDHSVGRPQMTEGRYREAYKTYQKVLAISYQQGNLMGVGIALLMLGDSANRANQVDDAISTTMLAYQVAQVMNVTEEMGVAELALARMLKDLEPGLSVAWLLRAKEHLKGTRYVEDYVRVLPRFADHLRRQHENQRALATLSEAWKLAQSLGNAPTQKWAKWEVALDYAKDLDMAGQHEQAMAVMEGAQSSFTPEEKRSESYTSVLYRLARSNGYMQKTEDASRYYLASYANYERNRADAPGEAARAQLDQNYKGLVDAFVQFQLESKDVGGALALLESNKARTLNEILDDPSYKDTQEQWKAMERKHAAELTTLAETSDDPLVPASSRSVLVKFLSLQERQDQERKQWQALLRLQETTVAKSLSPQHVETLRRQLPSDVGVMSFFIGYEQAGVFVMSRQALRYVPLTVDLKEYQRAIQQLRVALTNPHNDFYREPAQWLYRSVLEPGLKLLPKDVKTLVYSPDGLLSVVPLEVFMDGDRFLGERLAIYRVPSLRYATAIQDVKAPPATWAIACVDPDIAGSRLPFQQETGEVIKTLYGTQAVSLTGKDCTEQNLASALHDRQQRVFVHIGAHGVFYPSNAMDSMIWLASDNGQQSQGQAWTAKAMATVDMTPVDLVTLSSCETGLTDPKLQRDVFGIVRALFFSGAKRVVAPLWAVHDQGTAEFMREFHAAYARKVPAVFALQQAQRTFIASKKYRHPFYWSAFVLTGAAR